MGSRLYFVVLFLLAGIRVYSHPEIKNAIWIQSEKDQVRLMVEASLAEIKQAHQAPFESLENSEAFEAASALHAGTILERFVLSAGTNRLQGTLVEKRPPLSLVKGEVPDHHHSYVFTYSFPVNEKLDSLHLRFVATAGPGGGVVNTEVSHTVGFTQGPGSHLMEKAIKQGETITFFPTQTEPVPDGSASVEVAEPAGPVEPLEPELIASSATPKLLAGNREIGKKQSPQNEIPADRNALPMVLSITAVLCVLLVFWAFRGKQSRTS